MAGNFKLDVLYAVETVAYHYYRARYPLHAYCQGATTSTGSSSSSGSLAKVLKESLTEIDQAGRAFVGLGQCLPEIEKTFGSDAKVAAAHVLHVFEQLHKLVAGLNVDCITFERVTADLAAGAGADEPELKSYLSKLERRRREDLGTIAGIDGAQGLVGQVMSVAVSNLKSLI
ncbi:hypothetical protein [Stenotrophomonas maltophilia]|uniref:hypothetical protein n=1 Tax=Stenotrophomonas maltophilia TaxID=40324 RepID=UPI00289422D0|nr:hypothetical protein [Stenotrophomonas maltophilia]MDT3487628.1 hypothetical protein [Stenotrophomonas maltophilia]